MALVTTKTPPRPANQAPVASTPKPAAQPVSRPPTSPTPAPAAPRPPTSATPSQPAASRPPTSATPVASATKAPPNPSAGQSRLSTTIQQQAVAPSVGARPPTTPTPSQPAASRPPTTPTPAGGSAPPRAGKVVTSGSPPPAGGSSSPAQEFKKGDPPPTKLPEIDAITAKMMRGEPLSGEEQIKYTEYGKKQNEWSKAQGEGVTGSIGEIDPGALDQIGATPGNMAAIRKDLYGIGGLAPGSGGAGSGVDQTQANIEALRRKQSLGTLTDAEKLDLRYLEDKYATDLAARQRAQGQQGQVVSRSVVPQDWRSSYKPQGTGGPANGPPTGVQQATNVPSTYSAYDPRAGLPANMTTPQAAANQPPVNRNFTPVTPTGGSNPALAQQQALLQQQQSSIYRPNPTLAMNPMNTRPTEQQAAVSTANNMAALKTATGAKAGATGSALLARNGVRAMAPVDKTGYNALGNSAALIAAMRK